MESVSTSQISSTFIWRRVHSLMGFWLVLYLILHLLTNSQAALWIGEDGNGFVRMVNSLESIPYLQVVEFVFIGIPLAIHLVWGVHRALIAKINSHSSDGSRSSLAYSRNKAYTWQRLSSWILLFGILGHVVQMRFVDSPKKAMKGYREQSMVKITFDSGLYTLCQRLGVTLYNQEQISALLADTTTQEFSFFPEKGEIFDLQQSTSIDVKQHRVEERVWAETLASYSLKSNQVVAIADSPGKAMLLMVRDTFKSLWMAALYTIFVLAAAFHAFNGFWTFLITWGAILSYRSQKSMVPVCLICAVGLAFLGLAAIWGSYWLNLRY